ncbi:MAG: 50S ribosomal protein L15 [Anaerolineales bacterium]|nr:50S ribosomal protein L15 [Anaerolineales bacterium]
MKLHELKPNPGANKKRNRVGRGISAGQGKTAGRGTKGQKARAGWGGNLYRQGGNLPFFRRLPFKRGFTNIRRVTWNEINLDQLHGIEANTEVNPELLEAAGMLNDKRNPVVLMGRGDVTVSINARVHRVTKCAREKIEAAGGSVEIIERA